MPATASFQCPPQMYFLCEMYFSISCFDNEVGGGALLGVVLARQMLLLHALLQLVPPRAFTSRVFSTAPSCAPLITLVALCWRQLCF